MIIDLILKKEYIRLKDKLNVNYFVFKNNIMNFADRVAAIESDKNPLAKNSTSSAKGMYQYIDSAVIPALTRLARYDIHLLHKNMLDYSTEEQTAIFLADIFQKTGTDKYLIAIANDDDMKNQGMLYAKFHHTNPDAATLQRMNKFFAINKNWQDVYS